MSKANIKRRHKQEYTLRTHLLVIDLAGLFTSGFLLTLGETGGVLKKGQRVATESRFKEKELRNT